MNEYSLAKVQLLIVYAVGELQKDDGPVIDKFIAAITAA